MKVKVSKTIEIKRELTLNSRELAEKLGVPLAADIEADGQYLEELTCTWVEVTSEDCEDENL